MSVTALRVIKAAQRLGFTLGEGQAGLEAARPARTGPVP